MPITQLLLSQALGIGIVEQPKETRVAVVLGQGNNSELLMQMEIDATSNPQNFKREDLIDWDEATLRGALFCIPSDDYQIWVNVAIALKGEVYRSDGKVTDEEAWEMWSAWSNTSDKYDEGAARAKWDGIQPTGERGIASIYWVARNEYNWDGRKRSGWTEEERIQNVETRMREATGPRPVEEALAGNDNEQEPPQLRTFDNEIDELNSQHFVVREAGKTCVMKETYDRIMKRRYLLRSTFEDFKNYYCNRFVEVEQRAAGRNGRQQVRVEFRPLGQYWLSSPQRRQYEEIVFAPGIDMGANIYNLWRGFTIAPKAGNWDLLKRHIFENICNGEHHLYEYYMNWMAFAIQYPNRQAGVAVVLKGNRGVGKGTAVSYFGELFGQHFLHVTSARQVTGNFNNHLRDCVVLFSDEAVYAGAKHEEATLKGMITESHIAIEAKGRDLITVKNNLHVLIATNNDWAVPAGIDERRFFVLNVSDKQRQNLAYFDSIRKQMNEGGKAAMLQELRDRDIRTWSPFNVPKTFGLWEQKIRSMEPSMKWWFGKLMDGQLLDYWPHWEQPVPKQFLFEDYVKLSSIVGNLHRSTETELGMLLQKVSPIETYPKSLRIKADPFFERLVVVKSQDGRLKHWQFAPLEDCRRKFEEMVGQTINWDAVKQIAEGIELADRKREEAKRTNLPKLDSGVVYDGGKVKDLDEMDYL